MPTLMDIMAELDKPGLDPRGEVENLSLMQASRPLRICRRAWWCLAS